MVSLNSIEAGSKRDWGKIVLMTIGVIVVVFLLSVLLVPTKEKKAEGTTEGEANADGTGETTEKKEEGGTTSSEEKESEEETQAGGEEETEEEEESEEEGGNNEPVHESGEETDDLEEESEEEAEVSPEDVVMEGAK